jgi:DNA topoisomerase-1
MDRVKFDRALALAESLPAARRGVTIDLRREGLPRERVLAVAFRMLDTGSLRVGSERYADEHGSYGLSTLLGAHARVDGDRVLLDFPAKSGQAWASEIRDEDLAAAVRVLRRSGPRARLLAFRDERGRHPVTAEEINADVRERTGGDFTAKDFRTLHGTIAAAAHLAQAGPRASPTARRRVVAEAMRVAAAMLGNTATIARTSYVDPRVVDHYDHGRTIDPARLHAAESELRALLFA